MSKLHVIFFGIVASALICLYIAFPNNNRFQYKLGLDIQGGMQVVLEAQMDQIAEPDRLEALNSAREIILRRVDLYGIAEPTVQTSISDNSYRLIVELPGVENPQEALELVGRTAQLEFVLMNEAGIPITIEEDGQPIAIEETAQQLFIPTGLTGKHLKRSTPQIDPTTYEAGVALEFDEEGRDLFAQVTQDHVGERLSIMIDGVPEITPVINTPILDGRAVITGDFTSEEAKQLSVQLNAGALPVPIVVLEQRTVGASLGEQSVSKSVFAGVVGIGLVMLFMTLYYGVKGFLASLALMIYAVYTAAIYKVLGVTMTLPGIAGLLLSVGMAVDSNILIFERMKEELRNDRPFSTAMEMGFGRAWDSIKDANLTTIFTALILINPMNLSFLNTAGLVRGFGITLLIGVLLSLFTGIVVTRTLMRLFLKGDK